MWRIHNYLDDLIEVQQSHIQQVVFGTVVQQQSQAFGAAKWQDILTLLKMPLKSLHRLTVISYICEQGFSKLVEIKTKKRSTLDCEQDMIVALSKTEPSIFHIVYKKSTTKETLS